VDAAEVVALLLKQHEEKLAEAVTAGKLTQEEADKRSENLQTMVQKMVEGTFEKVVFPAKDKDQAEQAEHTEL
jgi:hypothetical protein